MKDTDKITLTIGQIKQLVKESRFDGDVQGRVLDALKPVFKNVRFGRFQNSIMFRDEYDRGWIIELKQNEFAR